MAAGLMALPGGTSTGASWRRDSGLPRSRWRDAARGNPPSLSPPELALLGPHLRDTLPLEKTRSRNCPGTSFRKVLGTAR